TALSTACGTNSGPPTFTVSRYDSPKPSAAAALARAPPATAPRRRADPASRDPASLRARRTGAGARTAASTTRGFQRPGRGTREAASHPGGSEERAADGDKSAQAGGLEAAGEPYPANAAREGCATGNQTPASRGPSRRGPECYRS